MRAENASCSQISHVGSFLAAFSHQKHLLEALQTSAEQSGTSCAPAQRVGLCYYCDQRGQSCQKGDPELQCISCKRNPFRGGVTRIRAHIIGLRPALGVAACEPTEESSEGHAAAVAAYQTIQKYRSRSESVKQTS